jgi:CheY-like chemotaxis protein
MTNQATDVTLLLVEDDDVDAMLIERSLLKERIGNKMIRAHDGIEALELLESDKVTRPLVILLDLQMPRMGGIEFLKVLRANEKLSDLTVFVLTTSKSEEDMLKSYREHIAGYFVKGEAGENFLSIVGVLDSYWKVVHFPVKPVA